MVRRRKKALYEVIGKPRVPSRYDKTLDQIPLDKSGTKPDDSSRIPERATYWPKQPRMIQYNAGRIEMSIPYQIAVAVLLGVVLVILAVFRLGQLSGNKTGEPALLEKPAVSTDFVELVRERANALENTVAGPRRMGNNRIVIQTWQDSEQLEPVKEYFAANGISTEIREISGMYYLVTKDRYANPEKHGTDGYYAKQKIIELGAKYKAPPGYGSFGTKPFYDAYGMRFDD